MENRARPHGEEADGQEATDVNLRQEKAQNSIEGLLSRWREALQGDKEDDEEQESDDDTSETTPVKSRDGKLSSFLKSFLPKPELNGHDREHTDLRGAEHPSEQVAQFDPTTLLRPREEEPDVADVAPGAMDLPAPEVAMLTAEPVEELAHTEPEGAIEEPGPVVEAAEVGGSGVPPLELNSEPTEPPEPPRRPPAVPVPAPMPYERPPQPPAALDVLPQPVDPESRLNRGAVAGLLTVDLLNYAAAKRRDSKIEAAGEEHAKATAKKIEREHHQREALERRTAELEAQRARTVFERGQQQKPQELQEVALRPEVISRAAVESPKPGPERVEHIMSRSLGRPEVREVQARAQAEQVLQRVEQAAERNAPIEQAYEMRHEAKGADANLGWSGVSDATTVRSSSGNAPAAPQSGGLPLPSDLAGQPLNNKAQKTPSPDMVEYYKKAAQTGAAIALVLLLVFMIAFTLVRN